VAKTLFAEPYLSSDPRHQGLILHSIYHRPNGWDYVARPKGAEWQSSMWGDYHARELALLLLREARCESIHVLRRNILIRSHGIPTSRDAGSCGLKPGVSKGRALRSSHPGLLPKERETHSDCRQIESCE